MDGGREKGYGSSFLSDPLSEPRCNLGMQWEGRECHSNVTQEQMDGGRKRAENYGFQIQPHEE